MEDLLIFTIMYFSLDYLVDYCYKYNATGYTHLCSASCII